MRMFLLVSGGVLLLLVGWRAACATGSCPVGCCADPPAGDTSAAADESCGPNCRLSSAERAQRRDDVRDSNSAAN